ncbi:hypothetical protein BKA70DRAFT_1218548 [Coprinopsis sp. MPI-PUGE-AT-0042]|nr:hypothetical protein BKA70DRAFT_1218548 [Coprinopsis sp. MPI-PUGE-AT-0042]
MPAVRRTHSIADLRDSPPSSSSSSSSSIDDSLFIDPFEGRNSMFKSGKHASDILKLPSQALTELKPNSYLLPMAQLLANANAKRATALSVVPEAHKVPNSATGIQQDKPHLPPKSTMRIPSKFAGLTPTYTRPFKHNEQVVTAREMLSVHRKAWAEKRGLEEPLEHDMFVLWFCERPRVGLEGPEKVSVAGRGNQVLSISEMEDSGEGKIESVVEIVDGCDQDEPKMQKGDERSSTKKKKKERKSKN